MASSHPGADRRRSSRRAEDKLPFVASCVMLSQKDVPDLLSMKAAAKRITYAAFVARCDYAPTASRLGYDGRLMSDGRRFVLRNEPHVGYYKSVFRGRPCYYFVHSAIEYIFQAPAEAAD